ncbi:hypothetical protein PYR73_00510 [Acinetobacter soli]|nr:hypothetical protein PX669_12040 [Acinetobacter soli]WEI09739.1 hypothetical protein PYR73_00510 [Acinetobacter soli]
MLSFQTGSLRKIFNVLKLISMQVIGASIMGVPISGILEKTKAFPNMAQASGVQPSN